MTIVREQLTTWASCSRTISLQEGGGGVANVQILVTPSGDVVGVRKTEQSIIKKIIAGGSGAYAYGGSGGFSLESRRLTYATLVTKSPLLTDEQKKILSVQLLALNVHDTVTLVQVTGAEARTLPGVIVSRIGDGGAPQKPVVFVFLDP